MLSATAPAPITSTRRASDLSHSNAHDIEQKLLRGEIDLGLSTVPQVEGLSSHLIGYQDNVVIVPKQHPWARRKTISLSELDGQQFIIYNQNCVIRGYYDAILRSARVKLEIFAESGVTLERYQPEEA